MSLASEGQNKKLRMKAFLIHSPASSASFAGLRAALSLVVPLKASQGHCTVRVVHVTQRSTPEIPPDLCSSYMWHSWFFLLFLLTVFSQKLPYRKGASFTLIQYRWVSQKGIMVVKRDQELMDMRRIWGQIVAFYESWKVRIWNSDNRAWPEGVTMCTSGKKDLNYDEKFSKRRLRIVMLHR